MPLESIIADILTEYWLNQNPYCGMPDSLLREALSECLNRTVEEAELAAVLAQMEARGEVTTNPTERLTVVFPTRSLLEPRDPRTESEVGVYAKQLRLGGSQVSLRFFSPQVLERYQSDPRYEVSDYGGAGGLTIKDEFCKSEETLERDKVFIQNFGHATAPDGTPAVSVMLWYLGGLSVEHQSYWCSYEIRESCSLDPDFVRTNLQGEFTDRISIYEAVLQEIREINRICGILKEPRLFLDASESGSPAGFSRLTIPTQRAFGHFVLLLDNLMSDNLNRAFFRGKVALQEETPIGKGNVRIQEKGTITLLDEYLQDRPLLISEPARRMVIAAFRTVRNLRQTPAHRLTQDGRDPHYYDEQESRMIGAYRALRTLRLSFSRQAGAESYRAPDWLEEGRYLG